MGVHLLDVPTLPTQELKRPPFKSCTQAADPETNYVAVKMSLVADDYYLKEAEKQNF